MNRDEARTVLLVAFPLPACIPCFLCLCRSGRILSLAATLLPLREIAEAFLAVDYLLPARGAERCCQKTRQFGASFANFTTRNGTPGWWYQLGDTGASVSTSVAFATLVSVIVLTLRRVICAIAQLVHAAAWRAS